MNDKEALLALITALNSAIQIFSVWAEQPAETPEEIANRRAAMIESMKAAQAIGDALRA